MVRHGDIVWSSYTCFFLSSFCFLFLLFHNMTVLLASFPIFPASLLSVDLDFCFLPLHILSSICFSSCRVLSGCKFFSILFAFFIGAFVFPSGRSGTKPKRKQEKAKFTTSLLQACVLSAPAKHQHHHQDDDD